MPSSPILDYLDSLRARFQDLSEGNVASYIPQLAHANPDWFGICIATRDGFVYGNAATGKSRACGLEIGQEPIGLPTDEGSPYIAHNTC